MIELYPDQEENIGTYKDIYHKLRVMIQTDSDIQIILKEYFDEGSYIDVSGKKPDQNESLALEFIPWTEWLGMTINERTLESFNELEIIAHCLFEMTFVSFDEDEIKEQFALIKKMVEDYEKMTENEKLATSESVDRLLNKLNNE